MDKLFVMDYNMQKVGEIIKYENKFVQNINGVIEESNTLPRILNGIAPAPSQFPEANDVLEYYKMEKMDTWEYLKRSNGIKISREFWFMAEPKGKEIWLPIFLSERYRFFNSRLKQGAEAKVLMVGHLYSLKRPLDILPPIIKDYLKQDGETRFSTARGVVYDLSPYPADKGLIGRVIIDF